MQKSSIVIDKEYKIGDIDKRLFGSFVEHMGRCVYTGIYEPGHPEADENGFREDTSKLVKELGTTIIRYPGGNFVSGYNWTDGIGPKAKRPVRLDLAWSAKEPNQVGIDEFADWAERIGLPVMGAVNLGSGTPKDAGNILEYCNFPKGTYWSDLRIKNGYTKPHDIKLWCLGNEMDGPWQICHMEAYEYGRKACETAKIMKWIDPSVELVSCGSSSPDLNTFPDWDRIVLENTYENVDFISLHRYYSENGKRGDYLTSFVDMDEFIKTVVAVADYVKGKLRSKKKMMLSFDEYNVSQSHKPAAKSERWTYARPISEGYYSVLDALSFSGLLCTLINHADRVKVACLAQLVNVIAPISTQPGGGAIRQAIFYPFMYASRYARGQAIKAIVNCHEIKTETRGDVDALQVAAAFDEEDGTLNIFMLNCDQKEDVNVKIDLRSFGECEPEEQIILEPENGDIYAFNSFEHPENIKPHSVLLNCGKNNMPEFEIHHLSWNVIRIKVKNN
ncbi:MAG TPA: alpha-N-arabinofuranosidase [Clostridiaceae bacterium]|nr:alpha-N-arabinofuranosidase [Clostridiaceae bacterium]